MRISYTLSRYILWDLLRIFFMASGALAGIMSFGGLLRPLTQQGLDVGQVGQLLSYFTPAMTAYSFPIAALFATTMVYGRLAADNELTACRAAGISLLSVAVPAFLLGSLVVLMSFLFLSFVVPAFTLKAERVIYSNIAKLIASRIERSHQIPMGVYTIFAQDAYLPPPGTLKEGEQQVVLVGATIVKFKRPFGKEDWHYKVPEEFWTAGSATAYINETGENKNSELTVALRDGMTFPREFKGGVTTAIGALQVGPLPMQSPIKENTKFMDLRQLQRLYRDQQQSRRIQDNISDFLRHDQEYEYLRQVRDALNATRRYSFRTARGDEYLLSFGEEVAALEKAGEVVVAPLNPARDAPGVRRIRVQRIVAGKSETVMQAKEARLRVWPRRGTGQIDVSLKLMEEVTQGPLPPAAEEVQAAAQAATQPAAGDAPLGLAPATSRPATGPPRLGEGSARAMLPLAFRVAMPPAVQQLERRDLDYYVSPAAAYSGNQNKLKRELIVLRNDLVSEMHARMAFALSCLILVLVGCALGMMFRSGNFLTAFAVSFIPALMSITLIVAGQQTCGNIPWQRGPNWVNPLGMGITLIWSGNAANLAIASALLWRLWRT